MLSAYILTRLRESLRMAIDNCDESADLVSELFNADLKKLHPRQQKLKIKTHYFFSHPFLYLLLIFFCQPIVNPYKTLFADNLVKNLFLGSKVCAFNV